MDKIPEGLCQCGCGRLTTIPKKNHKKYGRIKGKPVRFIQGHSSTGSNNPKWNGGVKRKNDGYVLISMPDHPRADSQGYVREHILVAEKALGKPLPPEAIPHHVDENRANNLPSNLVVCQDRNYHKLIHMRMRALKACGQASWRLCHICGKYDDPQNLKMGSAKNYHRDCNIQACKQRRQDKPEAVKAYKVMYRERSKVKEG